MNGFRLVSESVKRITDKTFDKKFVLLARVVNYWPDIVGQEMAKHAIPTKLNYRKSGRGKQASYKAILDFGLLDVDKKDIGQENRPKFDLE